MSNIAVPGGAGSPGAAATIAVGSTNTLAAGSPATAVNGGSSSAAVLNFGIPAGAKGDTGNAGPTTVGSPNTLSPSFGTAYQATDPAKPSLISTIIDAAYTITIAGTQSDTVELRIGPVQATVANGSGGTGYPAFKSSLTGITLGIGMGIISRSQIAAWLPTGWYFAIRRISGSTATIVQTTDQSLG